MKLIICADERWGMAFNKRRLSRDTVQREHMLTLTADSELWMSPYSAKLFTGTAKAPVPLPENIRTADEYMFLAGTDDFVFAEREDISAWLPRIDSLYVYHWGRLYPSDLRVSEQFRAHFVPVRTERLVGSSHEEMIFEEYRKCENTVI